MSAPYPCPLFDCNGSVFVRNFGGLKAFGCDGFDQHTDSQVRYAMIAEGDLWAAENRAEMDRIERRMDPVAWLHDRLDEATKPSDEKIHIESLDASESLPTFATGFIGRERGTLMNLRGMTTLSGKPSSGKSWFALGAALNSALDGWDVHYLAAEANDVIGRRVRWAYGDQTPKRFTLHSVEPGTSPLDLIQTIREWVVTTRTMLVIDSISTLLALMRLDKRIDKWDAMDTLEMFLMRVRALTHGEVGIINISEANAAGETKGRVLDHRSDVSVNFKSIEDSDCKEVRVTKAWEGRTGLVGRVRVDAKGPGLEIIHDGAVSETGDSVYGGDGF